MPMVMTSKGMCNTMTVLEFPRIHRFGKKKLKITCGDRPFALVAYFRYYKQFTYSILFLSDGIMEHVLVILGFLLTNLLYGLTF